MTRSRRPLVGWLVADTVSITGTRVSMIAIPLFVLASTGSATRTGLVALAEMLPLVLLKALGGPVIDQLGARRVAVGCDLASVLVVGSVPLLYDAGRLPFGVFLALVALAGALRGPGDAAKNALAPQVAAAAGTPMERVTGLAGTVERTASMVGAAVAGLLIAAVGPADALVVDAASFALSAAVLLTTTGALAPASAETDTPTDRRTDQRTDQRTDTPPVAAPGQGRTGAYVARLREGWTFLRGDRLLLGIAVMVALTNLLDQAWVAVLMPVWAVDSGRGAAVLGLLFAVFGGASALGALAAAVWAARLPRYATYLVAFLLVSIPRFLVLALGAPLWLILGVFAVGGLASGFINPILGAVEFERIPAAMVGRVSSLFSAMAWSLMPLGGLVGGLLVDHAGLTAALLGVGAAYLLVTLTPALDRTWRELDDRPPAPSDVTGYATTS